MKVKNETLLMVGAIAIAAYILYRVFEKFREKVDAGVDFIAEPIANVISSVTLPGATRVNATIRLPDGSLLDATNVAIKETSPNVMTFTYVGTRYQLLARGPDNIYGAKRL